jgi:hypothetical protein
MTRFETFTCPECDHDHACPIIADEFGEFAEAPAACEACGAEFDDAPAVDERRAERQQMGISD